VHPAQILPTWRHGAHLAERSHARVVEQLGAREGATQTRAIRWRVEAQHNAR
jgi:hypothetical protein